MAAKVISFINLKGGVAKTTTTVGLGQVLSGVFEKKVLVIDIDPQTNATAMLIGDETWGKLDADGNTLATLFSDALYEKNEFSLDNTLQKSVGNVDQVTTLDLLPSSLRLIDLQDRLINMPTGRYQTRNPVSILRRGIKSIMDDYSYILIDCPPNFGYITLNALNISSGYIIPSIPDLLSTYGIPQIVSRIKKFSEEIDAHIVPVGIVATKVKQQGGFYMRTLDRMRNESGKLMTNSSLVYPPVFDAFFMDSSSIAEAAEYHNVKTLRQKWGQSRQYKAFEDFAKEFVKACEEV